MRGPMDKALSSGKHEEDEERGECLGERDRPS